jgi:hypothetical protein
MATLPRETPTTRHSRAGGNPAKSQKIECSGTVIPDYREHAMGVGANAAAIAYVELRLADGTSLFGVGIDKNIVVASLRAVVSGVNRALKR